MTDLRRPLCRARIVRQVRQVAVGGLCLTHESAGSELDSNLTRSYSQDLLLQSRGLWMGFSGHFLILYRGNPLQSDQVAIWAQVKVTDRARASFALAKSFPLGTHVRRNLRCRCKQWFPNRSLASEPRSKPIRVDEV